MLMWTRTYSKLFKGLQKEKIWHLWTDINNWPKWQDDLEYCKMVGLFELGGYFTLNPKMGKSMKVVLVESLNSRKFTDCTTFFGAKMYNTHTMEATPEGLKLTNTLVVIGPLKWLWIKLVANSVADSVPDAMETLVNFARGSHG